MPTRALHVSSPFFSDFKCRLHKVPHYYITPCTYSYDMLLSCTRPSQFCSSCCGRGCESHCKRASQFVVCLFSFFPATQLACTSQSASTACCSIVAVLMCVQPHHWLSPSPYIHAWSFGDHSFRLLFPSATPTLEASYKTWPRTTQFPPPFHSSPVAHRATTTSSATCAPCLISSLRSC